MADISINTLQNHRLAYPEAAWIARCGSSFPSHTQWLHKYLAKVDVLPIGGIPKDTYATTTSTIMKNRATVGSGKTSQGIPIHEQVSLDWVKWAISKRLWNLIYTKEKINATEGGLDLIRNEVRIVLDFAVEEGIFTEYRVDSVQMDSTNNNVSMKFSANTMHSIIRAEVVGSIHH